MYPWTQSKLNVKVLWFQGRVFNFGNPEFYRHHILEKWVWWWNGMCLWIWLVSILICRIGNASHVGLILNLKVGLYHPQRNFVFWESRDFIFGLEIKSDRIRTWFKPDQTSWNQISLLRWLHQKIITKSDQLKNPLILTSDIQEFADESNSEKFFFSPSGSFS